jgi:hypothetical protein
LKNQLIHNKLIIKKFNSFSGSITSSNIIHLLFSTLFQPLQCWRWHLVCDTCQSYDVRYRHSCKEKWYPRVSSDTKINLKEWGLAPLQRSEKQCWKSVLRFPERQNLWFQFHSWKLSSCMIVYLKQHLTDVCAKLYQK